MTDDEIPLNITGHEERDRPGESPQSDADGADETDDAVLEFTDGEPEEGDERDENEDEETVEPVELLVQLAEDGEIDPWDIDVVRVTDKFLEAIDEVDLRTSGRALFYASVLLRMKSDDKIHGMT
ncbi:MAG: segregation/condensation protein A, partial [Natrinema limicola]